MIKNKNRNFSECGNAEPDREGRRQAFENEQQETVGVRGVVVWSDCSRGRTQDTDRQKEKLKLWLASNGYLRV